MESPAKRLACQKRAPGFESQSLRHETLKGSEPFRQKGVRPHMSYLVFARKYLPQTFAEILGQDAIVTTLTNAVRQRRIGHAYLFTCPRGTGKTSTARIFAKALNCVEGPTVTPCLKCDLCQEIARGGSLDVLEIDGASNRGIDQIRTLRELAKFAPAAGTFKVYIIDEVHQITSEGFNALLKTLEEPPSHTLFILATTAAHKVPATILSRCQRYDFKRLSLDLIVKKIKSIAAEEHLEIVEEAALGIARAASGSLRDAESILDQMAAFAEGKIRAGDLKTLLGTIDEDIFAEAMQGIAKRDPLSLLQLVADAVNDGTDLVQWVFCFLSFLRNLLVAKVGAGPLGFEDLGAEGIERLKKLSQGFSLEELTVVAQVLTAALDNMRRFGEPRIPLEMALVRLSAGDSVMNVAQLIEQIEELEKSLSAKSSEAAPGSRAAPARPASPPAKASPVSLDEVRAAWPAFLEQVHQVKASTAAYLTEAHPVDVAAGDPPQLIIGFPKGFEFHRDALDRIETRQLIEKLFGLLLDHSVCCIFRIVDDLAAAPKQESPCAPAQPSAPKADPSALNSIAELFEGRVLPGTG